MPSVELVNVSKRFGRIVAVDNVSLRIEDGEYVALVGPSGCGKTTTLRIIAGLVKPDEGKVLIDGVDVSNLPPEERGIGFVFQNYALFPHMTVWENVTYGPWVRGWDEQKMSDVANEVLSLVNLRGREDAYPRELSGGMQQRVALSRALATETRLLLLDEPLGALDARIRVELRREIRRLVKDLEVTAIHVTHDTEEALMVSDKIVVMRRGKIEQVGSPKEIYLRPKTLFVAGFVGEMNFLSGIVIEKTSGLATVKLEGSKDCVVAKDENDAFKKGSRVVVAIRPENVTIGNVEEASPKGEIEDLFFLGSFIKAVVLLTNNVRVAAYVSPNASIKVGDRVSIFFDPMDCILFAHPGIPLEEALKG
ncbi:MAG: ABC transporter ATP-binding protein [Candidatus Jordarchaeales archaeon]